MSSRTMLWIVGILIVLAGGYYCYSHNTQGDSMTPGTGDQTQAMNVPTTPEPSKDSSDDAVIDYMVTGLANDQEATEKAAIDSHSSQSQAAAADSLNTNF